ncbi:MAG: Cysteine desulfurase, partial [uncultured Phycisphaerae bacterium]
ERTSRLGRQRRGVPRAETGGVLQPRGRGPPAARGGRRPAHVRRPGRVHRLPDLRLVRRRRPLARADGKHDQRHPAGGRVRQEHQRGHQHRRQRHRLAVGRPDRHHRGRVPGQHLPVDGGRPRPRVQPRDGAGGDRRQRRSPRAAGQDPGRGRPPEDEARRPVPRRVRQRPAARRRANRRLLPQARQVPVRRRHPVARRAAGGRAGDERRLPRRRRAQVAAGAGGGGHLLLPQGADRADAAADGRVDERDRRARLRQVRLHPAPGRR